MRVSDAVVERLWENDIDTVFGIPGVQTLPLNRGIENNDEMRHVTIRHETAASHQAWGYAESSGRMAATLVVPGPGDMNAMNGLKNALNDCTPLLHLSVETDPEIRGGDGIHETPPDTYDNVVKENILVKNAASTVAEVERAIAIAQTPPKGPVRVGIPKGFLPMDIPIADAGEYQRESVTDVPADDVDAAVDILDAADAPVLIVGGGVRSSGASGEVRAIAETLDAPVVTTRKGKGSIPEDHALALGTMTVATPELNSCLSDSDAALAVGTDFDAVATGNWSMPVPDQLVHVTMHPDDIGTGYDPAVGIVADAREALDAIESRLTDRSGERDGAQRAGAVRRGKAERLDDLRVSEPPLTSVSVIDTVRDVLPRDAVITGDAGGLRVWMLTALEVYDLQSYVNPGSWASMGTSYPAAIGAKMANPDRDVVSLVGDGGLMMCMHELHTAVSEDIPVVAVVCNNGDYAIISEEAERAYHLGEGAYGWSESPVDFAAVAEDMGMDGTRVETTNALRGALEDALGTDEPRLIEVMTDPREPQAGDWLTD